MARILDANSVFAGNEPKFNGELTNLDLMKTLSWYAQNKVTKDSYKYASDYFKKKLKLNAEDALDGKSPTFGFVCRILLNGGELPIQYRNWFQDEVESVKKKLEQNKVKVIVKVDDSNKVTIQDRIKEKSSECIAELESQIDQLIETDFKANVSPYAVMNTLDIKSVHVKMILEEFKKKRNEFDEVMNTDDKDLKEGYSNFTKTQLKKLIAYCDQIILDCGKVTGEAAKTRKPRKRKVKTAEQLVGKMKYCAEFEELKIKSVEPKLIVGVMQLWVYNTKTRKLGCYHAEDAGGLTVKGSTIQNFNETKSIQKKLRKPEVTIPEVMSGGKVFLRNVIDGIKAVPSALTGRINEDTILLKVSK
jgi:hypothetical protein